MTCFVSSYTADGRLFQVGARRSVDHDGHCCGARSAVHRDVTVNTLAPLLRICKDPFSNLSPEIGHPVRGLPQFLKKDTDTVQYSNTAFILRFHCHPTVGAI